MTKARRIHPRFLSTVIGLVIILAACGADDAGPDCPAEAPSPAPERPYAQDADLGERIPAEVEGRAIEVETVCATVYDPGGIPTSDAMLEAVGVGREDVTLALSPVPAGGAEDSYIGINAWRYGGADETTIRDAFLGLLDETGIAVEEDEIGGKRVHVVLFHAYYVSGDTLYAVLGEHEPMAAALAELP